MVEPLPSSGMDTCKEDQQKGALGACGQYFGRREHLWVIFLSSVSLSSRA